MVPDRVSAVETEDGIKWFIGEAPSSWEQITYLRKDALLEWLEKRLHEVGLAGTIHIIDVIDKLNSM